ncbi:MAG: pyridoxal phosphate-dependent aminotransferase [Bacteroides sp.]|nr:pyridoxal phosphate-dependent aminotransferase [Bacteroides sp.]
MSTEEWFDNVPDRKGSGSYKWDSTSDSEVIPLWVADMDFRTAPPVLEALRKRVEHGIFGYTLVGEDYYKALKDWFDSRHGYSIRRENVIYTTGVVPAISAIIKALTKPGDGVLVQTPVYNCFFSSIRNNGCKIIEAPLKRVECGEGLFTYDMDFKILEEKASLPEVTLMLLCNPHNPAGRAWNKEELMTMAEICRRHNVTVVSDEIHCELAMPGYDYVPYGTIDKSAIICISPSKAFNTAGLQIANIICPNLGIRAKIDKAININEVCDVNPFGPVALVASYSEQGAQWLDALRGYLYANYSLLLKMFRENLPECPVTKLEATYLPWVDVRNLHINSTEIEERMRDEAKVWVNSGDMYGKDGYIRINIACPRQLLEEGLRRIIGWLRKELDK